MQKMVPQQMKTPINDGPDLLGNPLAMASYRVHAGIEEYSRNNPDSNLSCFSSFSGSTKRKSPCRISGFGIIKQ